ncbi:uncharacterized protein EDB91DRAFT_1147063 [Suillus paluster]|uniref:uncharacterized protein n=1 Tax=Suillus paluster TaxID=48578 RepID=UPI001B869357|nr:uncharacterized protein EDB91DRAFT_1147063 [Suillus paluster]KAG1734217.1 hypothetical protein EDB91DRAFT_1147063 [Suillus paluster]
MFTSPSIIFALISFLAGANAYVCVKCSATLNYSGGTTLYTIGTRVEGQNTYCIYQRQPWYEKAPVSCAYNTNSGMFQAGDKNCPATATVKDHC